MALILERSLSERIRKAYEKGAARVPAVKQEADRYISGMDETAADCMRFLYAFMHPNDMLSYDVSLFADYVRASLKMFDEVEYAGNVPAEIFLTYVLSCRVNNENLDGSRGWLMDQLLDRVKGKSMTQAVLEVNYWCYEKATYTPTDNRTIAPLGMCARAKGRCGEESTLAVCAMRSVGIPARQCYVPRWSHCDDNHAWVEVWTDGEWHYIGACEPECILDKGWFTAAASKAMLVHAKAYSCFLGDEKASLQHELYALMNETPRYADCRELKVKVSSGKVPVKDAYVGFGIVNYSELFDLYSARTDENGEASFVTGRGDLYITVYHNGRLAGKKADVRLAEQVEFDMDKEGFDPETEKGIREERFELVPPAEALSVPQEAADIQRHRQRLEDCERIRGGFMDNFDHSDIYMEKAGGNADEIRCFLAGGQNEEYRRIMLDSLRDKDFADVSEKVLSAYFDTAMKYEGRSSREIFSKYILAPRIADEMLSTARADAERYLREKSIVFAGGADVWNYVRNMRSADEEGITNYTADTAGCLKYNTCPPSSSGAVFVQICRAAGIPARLNPVTGTPEYYEDGRFVKASEEGPAETSAPKHRLTIINTGRTAVYETAFTIGVYSSGAYRTLSFEGLEVKDRYETELEEGCIRVITTFRQIDGSAGVVMKSFVFDRDMDITLDFAQDRTREKLLYTQVPDTRALTLSGEKTGIKELCAGRKTVLAVAEPGKEPTEHLFVELLEWEDSYKAAGVELVIILKDRSGLENATLKRVLDCGVSSVCVICDDEDYFSQLHRAFGVGDERLPFAAAIDGEGKGLFAFANYNIGTAKRLLEILN